MKRYFFILFFYIFSFICYSAPTENIVKVKASAPSQVTEGQRFQLIYTIQNSPADSFRLPKMKSVRLISGPSKSTSTSTQIVGGRLVSSTSVSLTFIAVADKKGKVTIPSASLWSKGVKYATNEVNIEVMSLTDQQKKQADAKKKALEQKNKIPQVNADEISGEDLFIKTEWEDKEVFAESHNNLIVKLYYRVNVAGWDNIEWPKFKNCETTDAGIARNSRYGRARVNGVLYNTVIIAKKDVVPAKSGKLTFDNGSIDIILNIPNKNDFWGGYHKASKRLVIPGISTEVKPLEQKKPAEVQKSDGGQRWNL